MYGERVEQVLERAGWSLGRYGRTACPLHQGGNQSTFRYGERGWVCYAGCGKGTAADLAARLGLPGVPVMVGLPHDLHPIRWGVTAKLVRRASVVRQDFLDRWIVQHQQAVMDLARADRLFVGVYRVAVEQLDNLMAWVGDANERLVESHQYLDGCCDWTW